VPSLTRRSRLPPRSAMLSTFPTTVTCGGYGQGRAAARFARPGARASGRRANASGGARARAARCWGRRVRWRLLVARNMMLLMVLLH
jgi:hypothetical protein